MMLLSMASALKPARSGPPDSAGAERGLAVFFGTVFFGMEVPGYGRPADGKGNTFAQAIAIGPAVAGTEEGDFRAADSDVSAAVLN